MGISIFSFVERKSESGRWEFLAGVTSFDEWQRGTYGWLAGVTNWLSLPCVAAPRGLPPDASAEAVTEFGELGTDGHTPSWLSVSELLASAHALRADFPQVFNQELMGDLERLQSAGADRVVFFFDH